MNMNLARLDLIWLALLAATGYGWWLDASGALTSGGFPITALVFALAWLKGLGVLLEFMELRHAPRVWRWAMIGGLSVVIGLILIAVLLSSPLSVQTETIVDAAKRPRSAFDADFASAMCHNQFSAKNT